MFNNRTALRGVAAAFAVAALPALSACGSGFDAATEKVEADNAAGEAGSVIARAIVLVKSRNATPAALAGTLINQGQTPEVLELIELTEATPGARTITIEPNLTLRPGEPVALGTEGTDPLTIAQAAGLRVGNFANVVLRFRNAGEIRLDVPIEARTGFYSDIVPSTPARIPTSTPPPNRDRNSETASPEPTEGAEEAEEA